jgi:SecD/SecF fusion protein
MGRGTALRMAIKLGYSRAFSAILDSNVTTILTCVILYWLGSEEIKGFALTLGVGVVINMFTAYFITRMFFEMMCMFSVPMEVARYPWYFGLCIAGFGALLYGLGYWRNDEAARAHSVAMLFGKSLMMVAPGVVGLLLLMWLGRWIHARFQTGGRPRLPMQKWIPVPAWNWVRARHVFFGFSILVTVAGGLLFFGVDRKNLYDIEFLGGTAAQIDLRTPGSLGQEAIQSRLQSAGATLKGYGSALAGATVEASAGAFILRTPGVPAGRLEPVLRTAMGDLLSQVDAISYPEPAAESVGLRTKTELQLTREQVEERLRRDCAAAFNYAGEAISNAQVQAVGGTGVEGRSFEIVTLERNKDVVVGAIMETMQGDLDIQPQLSFALLDDKKSGGVPYFAISGEGAADLGLPLPAGEVSGLDLHGWRGGVAIVLDQVSPPQQLDALRGRLRAMRLQPGFEHYGWRESEVFGLAPSAPGADTYRRVMVVVADEAYPLEDQAGGRSSSWVSELAEPEVALIRAALTRQTSLSQITQFDQQISGEAQTNAYIAVVLSWLVIILYVWFRFGDLRWGLAAVVALVHDVLVGLGALGLSFYIADHFLGRALLVEKFRIDMAVVAALLTVIGYSVNDTIVVFDRIRENRGRAKEITPGMVNDSINQTLSRTFLTGLSVMLTIIIMYVFGGRGIHGFNYVLFAGIMTGTYSSFAIAGQLLIKRANLARA